MRLGVFIGFLCCTVVLGQSTQPSTAPATQPKKRIVSRVHRGPGTQPVEVVWCRGTVRDDAGRPVAGARVYAYAIYHGGIRMYENVRGATTDADGHYEIRGDGYLQAFSATMLALAPGRPPALAWMRLPEPGWVTLEEGQEPPPPPPVHPPTIDLTIATRDAKAEVLVLRDGKPAAGASVQLRLQGANLKDQWARGGDALAAEVVAAYHPVRLTDAGGIARFDGMLPGNYSVFVHEGDEKENRSALEWRRHQESAKAVGTAQGVPLRVGETLRFSIAIYPQSNLTRMRLIPVDGHPPVDERVAISWGSAASGGGWNSSTPLKDNVATQRFDDLGISYLHLNYQDAKSDRIPLTPPYYQAAAMLAVSPRLTYDTPIEVKAKTVNPGEIVVTLLDVDGKPLSGKVELAGADDKPHHAVDTDAAGVARFPGVPPGQWYVRPAVRPAVTLEHSAKSLPADRELTGHITAPPTRVVVDLGTTSRSTLQMQSVGYVRGRLIAPAGAKAGDYAITLDQRDYHRGARTAYMADTGDFVAGPFPLGKTRLRVWRGRWGGGTLLDVIDCDVKSEVVTSVAITPPALPEPRKDDGESVMLGMGGISATRGGSRELGTATLADGKTPALGAMVFVFDPMEPIPVAAGMADARGLIRQKNFSYMQSDRTEGAGSPAGRVAVAILPGYAGAAIVDLPLDDLAAMSLKLPPPRSVRGRVTVGGKLFGGQAGQIRVLAQHQGLGKLDGLLSVSTTASATGDFELAGLSAGTYTVQAALDDVWLSASLVLGGDQPLTLDIAEPGPPIDVQVNGDAELTIERPAGPLAELLWPRTFVADGAGVVHVPAVEAGEHRLRAGKKDIVVSVPPLSKQTTPVRASMQP